MLDGWKVCSYMIIHSPSSPCFYTQILTQKNDSRHKFTMSEGHFTHEPRAVTMKLWEPKRKCPKAVRTHLQNHLVWSQTLKCRVKVICDRTLNQMLFSINFYLCRSSHLICRINQRSSTFGVPRSLNFVLGLPPRDNFWKQSKWPWTHDPFDAM